MYLFHTVAGVEGRYFPESREQGEGGGKECEQRDRNIDIFAGGQGPGPDLERGLTRPKASSPTSDATTVSRGCERYTPVVVV